MAASRRDPSWQAAALRESERYGTDLNYARSGLEGRSATHGPPIQEAKRHTVLDWAMLGITAVVFVFLFAIARPPMVSFDAHAAAVLLAVMIAILAVCGACSDTARYVGAFQR